MQLRRERVLRRLMRCMDKKGKLSDIVLLLLFCYTLHDKIVK